MLMYNIHNCNPFYFDNACQTQVLQVAINSYLKYTNLCAGRSGYKEAEEVQKKINETRRLVKEFFQLENDWEVVFGYNTTYLINLFVTTFVYKYNYEIVKDSSILGHNSTFLQEKNCISSNDKTGSKKYLFVKSLYSNVDGQEITVNVKKPDNTLNIFDIAQGVFTHKEFLNNSIYVFSGHKFYSTHLGIAIAQRKLLKFFEPIFVGGGAVNEVNKDYFIFSSEPSKRWEPGLQHVGSIAALGEVIKVFLDTDAPSVYQNMINLYSEDIERAVKRNNLYLAKQDPNKNTSVFSIYRDIDDIDFADKFSNYLSEKGLATRSGVLCADSYFIEKQLPPVCRVSLGFNNSFESIRKLIDLIKSY